MSCSLLSSSVPSSVNENHYPRSFAVLFSIAAKRCSRSLKHQSHYSSQRCEEKQQSLVVLACFTP